MAVRRDVVSGEGDVEIPYIFIRSYATFHHITTSLIDRDFPTYMADCIYIRDFL